ncbi:MAG: hypothetical protein JSW25_05385 [Thermoplasmata archaeon]|nr:MAG: hypothetical protein JSW25_05385 [Thermoplasmata archaeon]
MRGRNGDQVDVWWWGRTMAITLLSSVFFVLVIATAVTAEDRLYFDVDITEVGTWSDPGGGGQDIIIDQSSDGERLVLLGYSSPDDIRLTDRDLNTIAVLFPPRDGVTVRGVHWSSSGEWVCAWGSVGGGSDDLMWMWDTDTYQPSDWLFENYTAPLAHVDSVLFMIGDEIMAISGRDSNGTSRVLLIETSTSDIRRNYRWEDNASVVRMGTDNMRLICLEDTGTIRTIHGTNWEVVEDLGGHDVAPSSDSFGLRANEPWLVGYEDGSAAFWGGNPAVHERSADFGAGPVLGIGWAYSVMDHYYLVATPSTGGSKLMAYNFNLNQDPAGPASQPVEYEGVVTSMFSDAKVRGQFWLGFDDGSVRHLNVSVIPDLPPFITIEVPVLDKEYTADFIARGKVYDDHDNIQYVRVILHDGDGFDANVTGDTWTYQINISEVGTGVFAFIVTTEDGKHEAMNSTSFVIPGDGEDDELFTGNQTLAIVVAVAVVLFLSWRYIKGRASDKGQDGQS